MTERSDDSSLELANVAARVADESKATDIVILDVGDVLSITGFFVIAGASNPRLVRATVEEIERVVKVELDRSPVRIEGLREQQWILMDYGDVVVHVFLDSIREFYEIERLYMDVPRIDWAPRGRHRRRQPDGRRITAAHLPDPVVTRDARVGIVQRPSRGFSSVGRALPWHGRGQGFDSLKLHGFLGFGRGPGVLLGYSRLIGAPAHHPSRKRERRRDRRPDDQGDAYAPSDSLTA